MITKSFQIAIGEDSATVSELPLGQKLFIGSIAIKRENVDEYLADLRKVLKSFCDEVAQAQPSTKETNEVQPVA